MVHVANIVLYIMGWALFVAGQAQNSIRSKTNGLPEGFEGLKRWLDIHWLNLAHRAFWSGLLYGLILHKTMTLMLAVGLPVTSFMVAGFGGWSANGMLYQIFGVLPIPGLRKEVADFAPPANAEIVPPSTTNISNPTTGVPKP